MNGDPCQALADNLNQLETDAQSLRDLLQDASSPEKEDLLKQVKVADQQIIAASNALAECRKAHPTPSGPAAVTSTFTGTATIDIASGNSLLQNIPQQSVTFTLVFDGSEVHMSAFDELSFTKDGINVTVTMTDWAWGTFDPTTGLMVVPVTFQMAVTLFGQFLIAFKRPYMTTEQGPPVERYSPMGMRLNFQTGSVTLVGAALSTDGDGQPQDYMQIIFSGTLSPVPVQQPAPRRRTAMEEIETKAG